MLEQSSSAIFDQGWGLNGFIAVANAVNLGCIDELCSAACEAVAVAAQHSPSVWLSCATSQQDVSRELVIELLEEDEAAHILAQEYLAGVSGILGHNSAPLTPSYFLEVLREWAEGDIELTAAWISIYRHTWRIERDYRLLGLTLLAPFCLLLLEPELDWRSLDLVFLDIADQARDGPVTLAGIASEYENLGVIASLDLLHFAALNHPKLITVPAEDLIVDQLYRAVPIAHLAKHILVKSKYVVFPQNSWRSTREVLQRKCEINREGLYGFFAHWGAEQQLALCILEELVSKIWSESIHCCNEVQGLPAPVEAAIVDCLKRESRVLSRGELMSLLHADRIDLDPLELGPGRILAYVPGPRFASSKTCLYVLSEWVQDAHHSRNRISATRVITPRRHKDVSFSEADCKAALARDPVYLALGATCTRRLARSIAIRLLNQPTEPYYLNKMAGTVERFLASEMEPLGGGLLVDERWHEILTTFEKPARQRSLVMKTLRSIASRYNDSDRQAAAATLLKDLSTTLH
jgi:hypothetical protein